MTVPTSPPSPSGVSSRESQSVPPSVPSGGKGKHPEVERLRAEIASLQDAKEHRALQALLLHETGLRHESLGEEPTAARDYLAAFNADSTFREPLEALIRILGRRKSFKNLGKLLDALVKNSDSAEDRARGLWELACLALEHDKNKPEAREKLEEAVAENPDDATSWLELEIAAAEAGDVAGVMRAVEARVGIVGDTTYKALLYIQLAELSAKLDQQARAYEFLDAAAALEGHARFQTRLVLERVAAGDPEQLGRALEGQAELIAEAVDDAARGDEIGVPVFMRTAAFAADAWLRAAEIRRSLGDAEGASALLAQAARLLPESSVIGHARIALLETQGELDGAATLARTEITKGAVGANAASLWLRAAEAAAASNDRNAALAALSNALKADPKSIPARAIELDLVGDGEDPAILASSLEDMAEAFATDAAKSRAFVLAAYAWACLAKDVAAAKASLSQASALGLPAATAARLGRAFAAILGDAGWREETTKRLLVAGADADETPSLWFELGRSRLLRDDLPGAEDAFARLAKCQGEGAFARAAWLARALAASAIAMREAATAAPTASERSTSAGDEAGGRARDPKTYDDLAAVEPDPEMARGYGLVAALRALQSGDAPAALARLQQLHEGAPGDEVVATFLAELACDTGDLARAAAVLATCAAAATDPEIGAPLHLESALRYWTSGDRPPAIAEMEAARALMPKAGAALLTWARRGVDADTVEGRRAAIEASVGAGGDPSLAALERFGLEIAASKTGGDADTARDALDSVDATATDDIALAAALGRLVWDGVDSVGGGSRDATSAALEKLEMAGGDASRVARAERARIARDVDGDPGAALQATDEWVQVEPTPAVALEWLGAAVAARNAEAEIGARRALASHLQSSARASMDASAAMVALLEQPGVLHALLPHEEAPARLMNLELAPPGCDPRRRATALHQLGGALGPEAEADALSLAGWSYLASGDNGRALEVFKAVVEVRADDVAAWEGVRASAQATGDTVQAALAAAQLGALSKDDVRGGGFWEHAGLLLLEHEGAQEDAEIAFERAFDRNPRAEQAFDKLFRAVRAKKDDDRLLDLIGKRLEVAENESEIGKLFWERARVLQKRGDADGALAALENVTMLEPDHVGALALAGTICIQKGAFAEAAPLMARLSTIREAPSQQRLVSGITACDLYENKLGEPEKALEVLVNLHREGLATLPVRERLARAAARTGAWSEATNMLEQLMVERAEPAGRVEAARLAMAIWRDKVADPKGAKAAVEKLLGEIPDDPEALDLALTTAFDPAFRGRVLGRGKQSLIESLQKNPVDLERVSLLSKIADAEQDGALRQTTLGALVALGKLDRSISDELASIDAKLPGKPQIALDRHGLAEVADPSDTGPVHALFALVAETVTTVLGPSLDSLGVTRKHKVAAKGGPPIRMAVAEWWGAVGFTAETDFELYVGGPDPHGVQGVAGDVPALVVGPEVTAPFTPASRSAIAREVFALRRGICSLRKSDDTAIASVAIAIATECGFNLPNPGYAVFAEIQRGVKKEISSKVKKAARDVCQRFVESGQDPKEWAAAARRSMDRMAAIAAGDVSVVLAEMLSVPRTDLAKRVNDSERAQSLLRFVLSPGYLELRKKLGMGVR